MNKYDEKKQLENDIVHRIDKYVFPTSSFHFDHINSLMIDAIVNNSALRIFGTVIAFDYLDCKGFIEPCGRYKNIPKRIYFNCRGIDERLTGLPVGTQVSFKLGIGATKQYYAYSVVIAVAI
jgi:hypothetical protein